MAKKAAKKAPTSRKPETPTEPPAAPAATAVAAPPGPSVQSVGPADTAKFEADIDAAFEGRADAATLSLAYKTCGSSLQAAQAAAGFSDLDAIAIYSGLVESARTLGAACAWA